MIYVFKIIFSIFFNIFSIILSIYLFIKLIEWIIKKDREKRGYNNGEEILSIGDILRTIVGRKEIKIVVKEENINKTSNTTGRIIKAESKGLDGAMTITVCYEIGLIPYELTEDVIFRNKKRRILFFPAGRKKTPVIGETKVGTIVNVMYNPENPAEAFLPDNYGILKLK